MTTTPKIHLNAADAAEMAEAFAFIADWLHRDRAGLEASLQDFVGVTSNDVDTLHADLTRLCFLLGGDDGTRLFGRQP